MNTNCKGRIAELLAMAKYVSLGYVVLEPVNKDGIYDFVIEKANMFKRVQVKKINDKGSVYILKASGVIQNKKETINTYYTEKDFDLLVGVNIDTGEVFEVPFKDCGKSGIQLRKESPKNKQKQKIRFAKDYKI